MTTREFSDTLTTLLDSYGNKAEFGDQASQADIVLDEYEKSVYLSMAQDDVVKSYIDKTLNRQAQGYDDTARRQVDFSSLTTVVAIAQTQETNQVSQTDLDYVGYASSTSVSYAPAPVARLSDSLTVFTPAMTGARAAYSRRNQTIPAGYSIPIGHQVLGDNKERICLIRVPITQQPTVTGLPTDNIYYDSQMDSTGAYVPLQEWDLYAQGLECKQLNDIIYKGRQAINEYSPGEPVYVTLNLVTGYDTGRNVARETRGQYNIIFRLINTSNIETPKNIENYNESSELHVTGVIYRVLTQSTSVTKWQYEDYIGADGSAVYLNRDYTSLFTNNDSACLINSFLVTWDESSHTASEYPMALGSFNFGANQVFSYGSRDTDRIKINNGYTFEPTIKFPAKLTAETKQKEFILSLDNVVSFDVAGNVYYKDATITIPKDQSSTEIFDNNKVQICYAFVNSDNNSVYERFWTYVVSGKVPVSEGYYEYVYLNILIVQEGLPDAPSPEPGPEPTPVPESPKSGYYLDTRDVHFDAEGGSTLVPFRFYDGVSALDRYNDWEIEGTTQYFNEIVWDDEEHNCFSYAFYPAGISITCKKNTTNSSRSNALHIVMYDEGHTINVYQDASNVNPEEPTPTPVPTTNIDFQFDVDDPTDPEVVFDAAGETLDITVSALEGSSLYGTTGVVEKQPGSTYTWLTLDEYNASDFTITAACAVNSSTPRYAIINLTIYSTDGKRSITKQLRIKQNGTGTAPTPPEPDKYLDIFCEDTLYFKSYLPSDVEVTYETDAQGLVYDIPTTASWITIEGEGRDTFSIRVASNSSHIKREATITVSRSGGGCSKQIKIVQDERPFINVSPLRVVATSDGGKYYLDCETSGTTTFSYERTGTFFTVKRLGDMSGNVANAQVELVFQKNKVAAERNATAILTVTNSSGEPDSRTVTILQEAATIYVEPTHDTPSSDTGSDSGSGSNTDPGTESTTMFSVDSTVYDDRSVVFKLPPRKDGNTSLSGTTDVLVILQEKLQAKNNVTNAVSEYVVKPISYAEYDRQMSKSYSYPLKKQAWRLFQNQSTGFDVLCEIIPPNAVKKSKNDFIYKLRYIRRPRPIILEDLPDGLNIDGYTKESTCQLNPVIHMDIVSRAVELILATRGRTVQTNNNNNAK